MGTFRHNKKRNAGLVYEFLVRHVSQSMIENNTSIYQKTLGLVRKYYGEGMVLSDEHELFSVLTNTRGVSENAARRILGEVQRQAQKQDVKKLDIKKSNLIKEINYSFTQKFWDLHRIPEYRLLATIQMVIDAARSEKRLTESVQNIQLEEGLVQYMTSTQEFSSPIQQSNEDVDQLVMAITAKKFQEKYSRSLNGKQQVLLEKFIRSQVTGDSNQLAIYLNSEMERIRSVLENARTMKEFVEDQSMAQKLNEAIHNFPNEYSNDAIEAVMLYQKLAEEVEADV